MKILVCDSIIASQLSTIQSAIAGEITWQVCDSSQESEIIQQIGDATIYIGGFFTTDMAKAARSLRFIQVPGAGLDEINLNAIGKNIIVANTYNHERSIAEYVFMAMIALSRRVFQADSNLRRGIWDQDRYPSLRGRTIGLIGFGHIGKQIARLAACFDMHCLAIKRTPDPILAQEYGLIFLGDANDLPLLLERSDFVVLAAPLTDSTRHLLKAEQLAHMKPTAYLINVARANLVDETALYDTLANHRIAGAALDVWYNYPSNNEPTLPAHLPFHTLDNVILTPHYSNATDDTLKGRIADITTNIQNFLNGKPLHNVVAH
ncbi:MAG TPA: 2-hydroxyacid dehydrogenase [Anaerolineae bacterium]|nr:2-hydroxyacid dehydrogenase [Anaerolineae bacterium]